MDLISTQMLRIDYRHRGSASDCFGEVYRLGFHEILTVDRRTTPTVKSTRQHDITRRTGSKCIVMQPLQHTPSDRDVSSGFYDIGGAAEMTEVALSKRGLRDGIHFYNRASQRSLQYAQGPIQIWNPRTEESLTSTLSKRRRPQITQSLTADTSGSGRSKRSRASVSLEASEDPPKQSSIPRVPRSMRQVVRTSTQKRTRSPLGKTSASAAEVSLREVEIPSSKRNIHDNVRAILVGNLNGGNLDGENEGKAKVHHP